MRYIGILALLVVTMMCAIPAGYAAMSATYVSEGNVFTLGMPYGTMMYNGHGSTMFGEKVFTHSGSAWTADAQQYPLVRLGSNEIYPHMEYLSSSDATKIDVRVTLHLTPVSAAVKCQGLFYIDWKGFYTVDFDNDGNCSCDFNDIDLTDHAANMMILLLLKFKSQVTVYEQPRITMYFTVFDQGTVNEFMYGPSSI